MEPIATCGVSNTLAVLIYDIEYGDNDYAIWKYSDEDKFHKSTIRYYQHDSDRAFFFLLWQAFLS